MHAADNSKENPEERKTAKLFEEERSKEIEVLSNFADPCGVGSARGLVNLVLLCMSAGKAGNVFSVEALERMMEDPSVQKMVYP